MAPQRVSLQDREEALAVCAKIRAVHPDILDRLPDGLYRYQVGTPEEQPGLDLVADQAVGDRVVVAVDVDMVVEADPVQAPLGIFVGCRRQRLERRPGLVTVEPGRRRGMVDAQADRAELVPPTALSARAWLGAARSADLSGLRALSTLLDKKGNVGSRSNHAGSWVVFARARSELLPCARGWALQHGGYLPCCHPASEFRRATNPKPIRGNCYGADRQARG